MPPAEPEVVNEGFTGLLIPVFCTVDVPAKVLKKLVTNVNEVSDEFSTGLYFVRSKKVQLAVDPETEETAKHFKSPFEGDSTEDVLKWFEEAIDERQEQDRLAVNSFIILDKKSVDDENTCLVVNTIDEEPRHARAEFWVAAEVLIPSEIGPGALNEGFSPEEEQSFKRGGEWWYTRADWEKYMDGDEEEV